VFTLVLGVLSQHADQPFGARAPGRKIARKVNAAHHALMCEFVAARQQRAASFGHHVREEQCHDVSVRRMSARV
jgi:hypothetical protein